MSSTFAQWNFEFELSLSTQWSINSVAYCAAMWLTEAKSYLKTGHLSRSCHGQFCPSVATIVSVGLRISCCSLVQLCWSLRSVEGMCPKFILVSNAAMAATANLTDFGWLSAKYTILCAGYGNPRVFGKIESFAVHATATAKQQGAFPICDLYSFRFLNVGALEGERYSKLSGSKWRNAVNRKVSIARWLN